MDALDEEITEATEAFLEYNWEDEGDDFFEESLKDEVHDESPSTHVRLV